MLVGQRPFQGNSFAELVNAILTARRISWSNDGRWIFAAVGEGYSDIILFNGLLP